MNIINTVLFIIIFIIRHINTTTSATATATVAATIGTMQSFRSLFLVPSMTLVRSRLIFHFKLTGR